MFRYRIYHRLLSLVSDSLTLIRYNSSLFANCQEVKSLFDRQVLATRLRELRALRKMSQEDLGKALGMSKPAISDIERGRRTTTVEKLGELASVLNVSLDYLAGLTDDPERR